MPLPPPRSVAPCPFPSPSRIDDVSDESDVGLDMPEVLPATAAMLPAPAADMLPVMPGTPLLIPAMPSPAMLLPAAPYVLLVALGLLSRASASDPAADSPADSPTELATESATDVAPAAEAPEMAEKLCGRDMVNRLALLLAFVSWRCTSWE